MSLNLDIDLDEVVPKEERKIFRVFNVKGDDELIETIEHYALSRGTSRQEVVYRVLRKVFAQEIKARQRKAKR